MRRHCTQAELIERFLAGGTDGIASNLRLTGGRLYIPGAKDGWTLALRGDFGYGIQFLWRSDILSPSPHETKRALVAQRLHVRVLARLGLPFGALGKVLPGWRNLRLGPEIDLSDRRGRLLFSPTGRYAALYEAAWPHKVTRLDPLEAAVLEATAHAQFTT